MVCFLQFTPGHVSQDTPGLYQLIPSDEVVELRGDPLTIGAWIWADQPVQVDALTLTVADLRGGFPQGRGSFTVTETPASYAFHASRPEQAIRAWVNLTPADPGLASSVTIYFDGLVMAAGDFDDKCVWAGG